MARYPEFGSIVTRADAPADRACRWLARAWAPVFLLAASCLTGGVASANGRVPAAGQLVLPRAGTHLPPGEILLRTTFGVALSTDNGGAWDWVCEPALGFDGVQDPTFGAVLGADGKGAYVYSAFEGLGRSTEEFCAPNVQRSFGGAIDLVVDPANPSRVVAVASKYDRTGDDGTLYYTNKLVESRDGGVSYLPLSAVFDPTFRFETVELAATDPQRVYVSGFRGLGPTGKALVSHSEDGGKTFAETEIPLLGSERGVYLATVDPNRADVVYVRTAGTADTQSRLLVSSDGGKTFVLKTTLQGPMLGFALTPSGDGLYIGGPKDRLLFAATNDFVFSQRSTIQVQCLATDGATLWACSNEISGFLVGASTDGGKTFARKLGLSTLRGPLACPAGSTTEQCKSYWPKQAADLGIDLAVDAGAPIARDAGAGDAGSAPLPDSDSGCSIAVARGGYRFTIGGLLLAAGLFGTYRAQRRSRRNARG